MTHTKLSCSCKWYRDLKEAGLGTLWGLLQHYPREHVQLHDTLQEGQLVQVSGTVARTKSFTTPSIQGFEAWVDMPSHSQAAGAALPHAAWLP